MWSGSIKQRIKWQPMKKQFNDGAPMRAHDFGELQSSGAACECGGKKRKMVSRQSNHFTYSVRGIERSEGQSIERTDIHHGEAIKLFSSDVTRSLYIG